MLRTLFTSIIATLCLTLALLAPVSLLKSDQTTMGDHVPSQQFGPYIDTLG